MLHYYQCYGASLLRTKMLRTGHPKILAISGRKQLVCAIKETVYLCTRASWICDMYGCSVCSLLNSKGNYCKFKKKPTREIADSVSTLNTLPVFTTCETVLPTFVYFHVTHK